MPTHLGTGGSGLADPRDASTAVATVERVTTTTTTTSRSETAHGRVVCFTSPFRADEGRLGSKPGARTPHHHEVFSISICRGREHRKRSYSRGGGFHTRFPLARRHFEGWSVAESVAGRFGKGGRLPVLPPSRAQLAQHFWRAGRRVVAVKSAPLATAAFAAPLLAPPTQAALVHAPVSHRQRRTPCGPAAWLLAFSLRWKKRKEKGREGASYFPFPGAPRPVNRWNEREN